jgi:hypothetical protein
MLLEARQVDDDVRAPATPTRIVWIESNETHDNMKRKKNDEQKGGDSSSDETPIDRWIIILVYKVQRIIK